MTAVKVGSNGALVPVHGFSRYRPAQGALLSGQTAWRSHDGLLVVSSREMTHLPGSGEPPIVGPQWLVSVSRVAGGTSVARCRATAADVATVVERFAMPAFDEDNHHPGIARHLWCPIDPAYQQACECKTTEQTIIDGDYHWTTGNTGPCRGCEYEQLSGLPCTIHRAVDA